MATELAAPTISVTKVKATFAVVVAFLVGVALLASIALSTGWRSSDSTPTPASHSDSPVSVQAYDCFVNRLC